ncbi:hypothetical protein D7Y13_17870 [Corallococcus praedator]|uniref:Ig-like domain-containing protein n=1 Tax=Corallococcus praedator TaxID=2316724 RepID=A0ABX9QIC5_9BACT|nr:hypothetical protein D7X74_28280 [Corallococcus sp. CA047B]RKI07465.1 hypothetical protein D7Y13_17870 [Corallococcus praedator]
MEFPAARWCCLLMLAAGRVGAAEPEAPPPAPAPVQAEPAAPATAETAVAEDAVWGEEALMQADFPPEWQKAAETLTQGPRVVCSGVSTQLHTPGLLLVTPQDSSARGKLLFIACPISDGVVMKTVSVEARALKGATCLTKPEGPKAATVAWSNGESSVLELKDAEATVEGDLRVLTSKGTVKAGRHQGQAVSFSTSVSLTTTLAGCMQPSGLATNTGITTVTFTEP